MVLFFTHYIIQDINILIKKMLSNGLGIEVSPFIVYLGIQVSLVNTEKLWKGGEQLLFCFVFFLQKVKQ